MEVPFYLSDGQTSGRGGDELVSVKVTAFITGGTEEPFISLGDVNDVQISPGRVHSHCGLISARVRMRTGAGAPSSTVMLVRHVSTEAARAHVECAAGNRSW